jgi:hypothetical protein
MDVLKLYNARWQQQVFSTEDNTMHTKWVNYYVLYRRVNHGVNQLVNRVGEFVVGVQHADNIDNEIFNKLNELLKIEGVENFWSQMNEFMLLGGYENLERARASKMGVGYPAYELQVNTDLMNVVRLQTRVMFSDTRNTHGSVLTRLPVLLNLNLTGNIPSLAREEFLPIQDADAIISEYLEDLENNLPENQ